MSPTAPCHAVEAYVTKNRTPESQQLALEAWRLLEGSYERVLTSPRDIEWSESVPGTEHMLCRRNLP